MASTNHLGGNYWGSLINQDKSATPLLTQLCEGLVKIITQLEPGPDTGLSPNRLSAFYKAVGGNDFVFRELGYPGLSLMYRTLGCFHSLQPSANAFDPPSIPCLLTPGFVRWQTLQLLLHPDEHAQCMQKAVEIYDVPKRDGGHFPKSIPRESFPSKPDEAMEKWQRMVLERLDEGHHRLKNSPYCSPYEQSDPTEGYFAGSSPHMRKSSRPPRTHSQDAGLRASPSTRRRSSVPNIPSPVNAPEPPDSYHWSSDQAFSAPNSAIPQSPKHRPHPTPASHRPSPQPYHRGANTHNANPSSTTNTNNTSNKTFHLNFENFHVPFISSPFNSKKKRDRASTSASRRYTRPRSSPRSAAVSTGSEASSEDSTPRTPKAERDRRRSSLAPPAEYNRYQRRHSHDSSYMSHQTYAQAQAAPPHSPYTRNGHPHNQQRAYPPSTAPLPGLFRDDIFNDYDGQGPSSTPGSPLYAPNNPQVPGHRSGRKRPFWGAWSWTVA